MYVCLCNALNDTKIREALEDGCSNCKEVMQYHGCDFECKRCIPTIHDIKKAHKENQENG